MNKGTLLMINAGNMGGSMVEGISNAPGEKEVLFPEGTLFDIDQIYTLHIDKVPIPEEFKMLLVKRMRFLNENGNKVTVRITDRWGKEVPEVESKLADLIEEIKNNGADIGPEVKYY